MLKLKSKKLILGILLCLCAALFALLSAFSQKAYAYTTANMPTGGNAIGNIVKTINNGNAVFDSANLNALAKKGGYDSLEKMVKAAEGGEIKDSSAFGETVVNFGSYEFGGTKYELTWVPVYLSRANREGSDKKDAILTLYLVPNSNENVSNQEKCNFADANGGTDTANWNGIKVFTDTYDSSYLRNYCLNGSTDYVSFSGQGSVTPPPSDTMTKFLQFIGDGALAGYIVKPKNVSWQMQANKMKNDPGWQGSVGKATEANYPTNWTNDYLWLPSVYETYDKTISDNSTETGFTKNGGLWNLSDEKTVGGSYPWLRNGYYSSSYFNCIYSLYSGGCAENYAYGSYALRPALHLNLSALGSCKHQLTSHPKETYCDKAGHEAYWECSLCGSLFSDAEAKNEIDDIVTVPATGHKFADSWSSNDLKHWHAATCGHDEKEDLVDHIWNDGEITKAATCSATGIKTFTCTVCSKTKTETIAKIAHTPEEVAKVDPTCTETGLTVGSRCKVCGETLTAQQTVPANGHKSSDWMTDKDPTCTAEGSKHKECTVCHTSLETGTIDKIAHTAGNAANCTTAQTCTACGFELAPKLGHNYEAVDGGTPPTCTTTGSGKVKCTRCNDEQVGASIPALGHIEATDEAKAPTCTETGLTEGKHCSRCDEVLTAQTEVPALGHDWKTDWDKDTTNHWHECSVCHEKKDETAHTYDWVITKDPTEDEEGEKEEYCTVCDYANGNVETIAKLVKDPEGNGDVIDLPVLPPNQDYDLEIAVKESDSLYNIAGITKGYKVELFVVDGEERNPYDNSKKVTLMLVIPEGMEDNFTLYCRHGDILEPVDPATYTVSGKSVTIRTTLPNEYVFNAPAPEEPAQPSAGIPWWVWVIIGLGGATLLAIVIVIIVVAKKKKGDNTPTDNGELLSRMDSQEQKIDELLTRSDDGGFNTPVELDENGNVIFK